MDLVTIELPNAPATARSARRIVGARLDGHPRRSELLVCVSELVTNAMVHARSAPTLRLIVHPAKVRVEVADDSRTMPVIAPDDAMATSGRGLRLVDRLSVDWGVIGEEAGKVVWFEFEGMHVA
jgi:two-component sensor histidine kinase